MRMLGLGWGDFPQGRDEIFGGWALPPRNPRRRGNAPFPLSPRGGSWRARPTRPWCRSGHRPPPQRWAEFISRRRARAKCDMMSGGKGDAEMAGVEEPPVPEPPARNDPAAAAGGPGDAAAADAPTNADENGGAGTAPAPPSDGAAAPADGATPAADGPTGDGRSDDKATAGPAAPSDPSNATAPANEGNGKAAAAPDGTAPGAAPSAAAPAKETPGQGGPPQQAAAGAPAAPTNGGGGKRAEIYTYQSKDMVYAMSWSVRKDKQFRLAAGSFLEDSTNRVEILYFDEDKGHLGLASPSLSFQHPFPATKIMFIPDKGVGRPDLMATSSDYIRIYKVNDEDAPRGAGDVPSAGGPAAGDADGGAGVKEEAAAGGMPQRSVKSGGNVKPGMSPEKDANAGGGNGASSSGGSIELRSFLNNSKSSEFCAPLTSFDWNDEDMNKIGTSSIDTTCTIWDIEKEGKHPTHARTHAHERANALWFGR